jgi:hypothetical protein
MKAITVKQPWALLICEGVKDIENRTWKTNFRGRMMIHASARPVPIKLEIEGEATVAEIKMFTTLNYAEENNLFGCIIGSVEIVDCVRNHPSVWAEKDVWNWVLAKPFLFKKPIENVKGKLSFWEYTDKI